MKKYTENKKRKLNKKGYVTLEVMISGVIAFSLIAIVVSLFAYIYPAFQIQRNVSTLARQAELNGGLTSQNIESFETIMNSYGFVKTSKLPIEITAETDMGNTAIHVDNDYYISKDSGELIKIMVKVPSNNIIARFSDKSSNYYKYETFVLSQKW